MASPVEVARASFLLRSKVRLGDVPGVKGLIKAGLIDLTAPGETRRQWTPLHIACWGSSKPQFDKEIIEALLLYAQKIKIEDQVRAAKDAVEGLTPADVAKERRDQLAALPVPKNPDAEAELLEKKRKFDKIIEWLEKGLPAAAEAAAPAYAISLLALGNPLSDVCAGVSLGVDVLCAQCVEAGEPGVHEFELGI
eukprot:CAMPEP_0181217920 /NCGR_PEP_ID=MMETSP1096-20121128/27410_1 /TAXON_ID=156174 ORGANISM="Chrysochromulina ericina, Strain CCMP281" /NCGR_SAMPLE_ID=MMETSP1096 /ASSEMBLY_ACC=CAM_ASM_000453 /LENGTH=194 /DNA_ID=CAMNT_0023310087 /DNA_START=18 /DNA_END=603 /DNA_ORIENTATION=-